MLSPWLRGFLLNPVLAGWGKGPLSCSAPRQLGSRQADELRRN